ncbi:hypothetical protein [Pedobacter zeae]|uniref:HlyD family secretion protein n=1 Tax=Pedobacter zeae TaxID=1737356 RepID=A0A7W6K7W9_9SPHI|nr:hypothetical protein [Pedobacter zeae]MBB4106752.1 hypothetical protein [Pedobacter zeae]GGH03540.1 hypothetical protein GCM10007422_18650 [Pedobacter zeae]
MSEEKKILRVAPPGAGDIIIKKANPTEVEIREENVQEILSQIPSRIINWSNALFVFLILSILVLSYTIKYPDIIQVNVQVKQSQPLVRVTLPGDYNDLLVGNGTHVKPGDWIGVKSNSAKTSDIKLLLSNINNTLYDSESFSFPGTRLPGLNLGDLQPAFAEFQYRYEMFNAEKSKHHLTDLLHSYSELKIKLKNWVTKYVISSPVAASVTIVSRNGGAQADGTLIELNPDKQSYPLASGELTQPVAIKIKKGQTANISLPAYPNNDFGVLRGAVHQVYWNENTGRFHVDISFTKGLKTTFGEVVNLDHPLTGTAEVIIGEKKLIQRLFNL